MNQYFKRQLKTPTCFGSFGASLKLLEMFCVRSRCLAAWNLDLWCVFLVRRVENFKKCTVETWNYVRLCFYVLIIIMCTVWVT